VEGRVNAGEGRMGKGRESRTRKGSKGEGWKWNMGKAGKEKESGRRWKP